MQRRGSLLIAIIKGRERNAVLLVEFVLIKNLHISQNKEQKHGFSSSNKEHLVQFVHATQLVTCHKSVLQIQKIFKFRKCRLTICTPKLNL